MRGLKPTNTNDQYSYIQVASFTDAWIETLDFKQDEGEGIKSHLLQMRGLKPHGKMAHGRGGLRRIFYICVD